MRPPQRVSDYSAAAQVLNLKTQVAVSVISLKQCVVGVHAEELERNTHLPYSYPIKSNSFLYLSPNVIIIKGLYTLNTAVMLN